MRKTMRQLSVLGAAVITAAGLGLAGPAHAVQRTFVSTAGVDANTATSCAATTPCRTFGAAITVTDPGGEIVILGSGGYGSFTITQSVSINAPSGVHAAITALVGDGLTINAPGATVTLNGLVISGVGGVGTKGINVVAAQSVILNSCRVVNFGTGIAMAVPAGSTGSGPTISITDSFIGFNTNGVEISGISGTNTVGGLVVDSQIMRNSGTAIVAGDRSRVTVANSAINNNQNAVQARATSTASRLYVAASAIANVSIIAVRTGPAGTGSTQVTLCDNSINYVNGTTGTAFQRDDDPSCSVTDTCRIFSCGNIIFGAPSQLEVPPGVVEPIGAAGGPISK